MSTARAWPPLAEHERRLVAEFDDAERRLNEGLIRLAQTFELPKRTQARWDARMAEMRSFLAACGDPQASFPAIHVTGTSGKGSVSTMIARALELAGYRVGLHTSPYLQVATEKNQVDGALMAAEEFIDLVDWIWPIARPRKQPTTPASIHGMASVALACELFRRREIDIAVFEAGCGGRHDLTNVLDPVATVITSVGMDHALALGPTLADIAWHKAGIMKPGVPAITGARGEPLAVIRREAATLGVTLTEVPAHDGPFWARNADLARATLTAIAGRFSVPEALVERAVDEARLPARYELAPEPGRRVILDGAHNPDKIAALVRVLEPGAIVVLGCLDSKDPGALLEAIGPIAARVIATEPSPYGKTPRPAAALAEACRARGIPALAEPRPLAAIERALDIAGPGQTVVVTGSLYLIGELRARWFPRERVLLQRTSWPSP